MAYDGYRSPRADHGFSSEYSFPGTRPVDPRATPVYPSGGYQSPTSSQYVDSRDPRESRDYSRSSTGYPSDPARDPTYQSRYTEYSAPTSERQDTLGRDYPPELYAQIKADVKAEVIRELKTAGNLPAEPGVPLTRTQSAQPTYTPPKPDYAAYGSPTNAQSYFSPTPRSPSRASPSSEPTALDKTWGKLFDNYGNPTSRLGELLRGLANHIIADFEPRNSIVVTPSKMAKYYEVVKIPNEPYLWSYQFTGRKPSSLSRLYRDLECQHHLVQDRHDEQPYIPGLTPAGFEKWMTILLKAYPDQEVERLQKAIKDMPINSAENPRERFPKEINRQLFPRIADMMERAKFERVSSMDDDLEEPKPVKYEPQGHYRSESAHLLERERTPYFGTSDSAVEDMPPPSSNLERERKPYVAQPGGGKTHDTGGKLDAGNRPMRANSTSKIRPPNIVPPPYHHRAGSNVVPSSAVPSRRKRSPSVPFGDPYRHSEPDISTTYESNMPLNYDDERYAREAEAKRGDWLRRSAEEEAREFEAPRDRGKYERDVGDDRDVEELRGRFEREELEPDVGYEEEYYRPSGGRGRGGTAGGYGYDPPYPTYR